MKRPKLSQHTIEEFLVVVLEAANEKGAVLNLKPTDVFKPWVVAQIPEELKGKQNVL